jgi:hypothetical protein
VLDWSAAPLIAAHFATVEREHAAKDGVIWCVNAVALRDSVLPPMLAERLWEAPTVIFDVALLEAACKTLRDFDAMHDAFGDICIFFEPPSLDARIANQVGMLSAMNGPDVSHDQYFRKISLQRPGLVRRIIIKSGAKSQIRDMLDQNNMHERMLFPGLPGLCDWLRRYYGPSYTKLQNSS